MPGKAPPPGPAPPALPARAWRGASAAGEGRGRAAPRRPLPARGPTKRRRSAPPPPGPRGRSPRRPSARQERGPSAAAAMGRSASRREKQPGKSRGRGGGGRWEVGGGSIPARARRRSRYLEPARAGPGRRRFRGAAGAGPERAPLSAEGNNRLPERRLRPRAWPRPLARPPSAPIGRDTPFESRGGRAPLAARAMARSDLPAPGRAPGPAPPRSEGRGGGGALGSPPPHCPSRGVMAGGEGRKGREGREDGRKGRCRGDGGWLRPPAPPWPRRPW